MSSTPSTAHFAQAQELWHLTTPLEFHRRVENFIYFSRNASQDVVIRLTEPPRRQKEDLLSELHWQNWMSERGARCANPLESNNARLVETLDDGQTIFYACVFKRAAGAPLKNTSDFTPQVMHAWGRTIAQFHDLTRDYQCPSDIKPRKPWREDFEDSIASVVKDDDNPGVSDEFKHLFGWLDALPRSRDTYGLVHTDLHNGNFFVSGDRLTVFDFDDACYHWFMYDLAVPLFYLRYRNAHSADPLDLAALEREYLNGYRSLREISSASKKQIEAFVRYRALIMYGWCSAQIQAAKLDAGTIQWCHDYKAWFRKIRSTPSPL